MPRSTMTTALSGLLVLAALGAGSRPAAAQEPAEMTVTVTVAGQTQTLRGQGQCGHEPRAWIYGKAAQLWSARYGQPGRLQVDLTYWRPAAGGAADQFSLSVQSGRKYHQIRTVRGGRLEGSGRSTFQPTALGGRFVITGKAADGAALQATIECARFGSIHAEGG